MCARTVIVRDYAKGAKHIKQKEKKNKMKQIMLFSRVNNHVCLHCPLELYLIYAFLPVIFFLVSYNDVETHLTGDMKVFLYDQLIFR